MMIAKDQAAAKVVSGKAIAWGKIGFVFLNKLFIGGVIFFAFFLAAWAIKYTILLCCKRAKNKQYVVNILADAIKILIIVIGVITALGTVGVNVTALVASLGLTSFAIGFAFKDFLSNLLSGLMIMFYHPYHVGDTIQVTSISGRVEDINLRYTIIKTENGEAYVPNGLMINNFVLVKSSS